MKTPMTAVLVMLTLALAVAGCSSSAQLVRRDAAGGRVALQGAFMPAMGEARVLMAEHCHGRFEAVEQGSKVEFRCLNGAGGESAVQVASAERTHGAL